MKREFIPLIMENGLKTFIKRKSIIFLFDDPDNPKKRTKIKTGENDYSIFKGSIDEIMIEINKESE